MINDIMYLFFFVRLCDEDPMNHPLELLSSNVRVIDNSVSIKSQSPTSHYLAKNHDVMERTSTYQFES